MKTDVFNQQGSKVSSLDLPDNIFSLSFNGDLVHQVIHSQMNNQRANTAHTKDRSEVRGGGKKPWQQKGLGRARAGSSRSPIWTGGGVTHGPRNDRNYKQDIPKVMRNRALFVLLSQKLKAGKILFVDNIKAEDGKTKSATSIMTNLQKVEGFKTINWKKHNNCVIYTSPTDRSTHLAFRNMPNVRLENMDQMNPLTLANTRYIILSSPNEIISYLEGKK